MSEPMVGEVMRKAQLLMRTKSDGAPENTDWMAEHLEKTGDHDDPIYWRRIVMWIEILIEEGHS